MGEETDGVVESVSKMQEKIKALTGVDIVDMNGAYKDTYTILAEIGEVWEGMSDIDQAALLELMAGKNRANTLAAILGNMEDLKGAYTDALNAEGSALRENETYLESIQGHIDVFNNSLQTMWMNFLNTDAVKWVVHFGKMFVEVADSVGLVQTAVIGLIGYMGLIKKKDFGLLDLFTETRARKKAQGAQINLLSGEDLSNKINELNRAIDAGPEAFEKYKQSAKGANNGICEMIASTEDAKKATGNLHYTTADYTAALQNKTRAAQADAAAQQKQTMQQYALNAAIVVGTMAISAAISALAQHISSTNNIEDEYNSLQSSISSLESNISSLSSELSNVNEKIDSLSNKNLSFAEADELKKLKEQSAELERQKSIQEDILKTRDEQNQEKSLSMINKFLTTSAAKQKEAAESGKTWGKAIGQVVGALAGLAVGGLITTATAGAGAGAGVAAGAAVSTGVSSAITLGLSSILSNLGGVAGEAWGPGLFSSKHKTDGTLIGWYESYTEAIEKATQDASEAEQKYFNTLTDKSYEAWQKKLDEVSTLQVEMYNGLDEMQGYISNLEYNDQTKNIIDSYNNLLTHINVTSDGNDIDAQISSIESLKSKFYELSKGVDENGKNMSLSAEQYAQYCSIVNQILAYTPSLIQGYDEQGNAILGAADAQLTYNQLITESIALLKEQKRQAAEDAISDSSLEDLISNVQNNYLSSVKSATKLSDGLDTLYYGKGTIKDTGTTYDNAAWTSSDSMRSMVNVLEEPIGMFESRAKYFERNIDLIVERRNQIKDKLLSSMTEQGVDEDRAAQYVKDYMSWLDGIISSVQDADEQASAKIRERLYLAPQSSKNYGDLSGSQASFVDSYIMSLQDLNKKSAKDIKGIRDDIINLTDKIAGDVNLQSAIDKLFKLNPSLMPIGEYQKQFNEVWKNVTSKIDIPGMDMEQFKSAFMPDEDAIRNMMQQVGDKLKVESKGLINNLSLPELKIAFEHKEELSGGSEFEDVKKLIEKYSETANRPIVQTYSNLVEQVAKFNDVASQTSDIILNNTQVTQEYKDSLIDLGVSEEELAECFDDNNDLVVTNAKKLQKLTKSAQKNTSNNIKLAKSQAELQYYDLYKEMSKYVDAEGKIIDGAKDQIIALNNEMNALEKTISKYSRLEAQLLGTTRAYEKFQAAQTADSESDYISETEEMILALGQAFSTAELGTESAQAAIAGLVPESVYQDLDTLDAKMSAIHAYFKEGKLSQYFTLEFDDNGALTSAEMKLGNLRKFIEDGLVDQSGDGISVFSGDDWQNFELNQTWLDSLPEGTDRLQAFADEMNVTKDVAFAFLESLNDHDIEWLNGDYSSVFDQLVPDTSAYNIYEAINGISDLNAKLAEGKIEPAEYAQKLKELNLQLEQAKSESRTNLFGEDGVSDKTPDEVGSMNIDDIDNYLDANQRVTIETEKLKNATTEYESAVNAVAKAEEEGRKATEEEIAAVETASKAVESATGDLEKAIAKREEFEEPTELEIEIATDEINKEIEEVKDSLDEKLSDGEHTVTVTIDGKTIEKDISSTEELLDACFHVDDSGYWVINAGVNKEELASSYPEILSYVNLLNSQTQLTAGVDSSEAEANLQTISDTLTNIQNILSTVFHVNVETDGAITKANDFKSVWDQIASKSIVLTVITSAIDGIKNLLGEDSGASDVNGTAHAYGTAHKSGNWGLSKSEHDALVGELGPEMVVDPHSGRYYTVGDTGAEMVDLPKGAIIFNHKQTESLLKNGYVASRGKAYAEGNAHVTIWPNASSKDQWEGTGYTGPNDSTWGASNAINNAADKISDAADEFEEVFDWIEVRLEELDETLGLLEAQLENAASYSSKNNIIDKIIGTNNTKMSNLKAGIEEYTKYASKLLAEVPEQYRDAAQDGAIAITQFAGEADEKTLEAIENYREWAQKVADLNQQLEETTTTIRDLAMQKFDNIYEAGDVRATVEDSQTEKLQNAVDLIEESGKIASDAYYTAMMENSNKTIEYLTKTRDEMQKVFNEAVEAGIIVRGSNEWYEMIDQLYQVDAEIDEATKELEEFQNAINDIYWDNFDQLINRIDYLKEETQNLIDLMDSEDMVVDPVKRKYENGTVEYWTADDVKWSKEGLASLGLYAQQMEIAEYKAKQYAEAIDDLTKEYNAGHYSENEYYEKLNELKNAQYESIEAYDDAKKAIVDLNKTRIDSIKKGIDKEIEAYEELIQKKKEALDAEKDMYDFQRSIEESNKEIADIERKIQALSSDNSASARAQRAKLEAELAKAQQDLQDKYYDRSIEEQQNALDKELENFQKEKDSEVEKMEEYLEDIKQVVADSLMTVQANASGIYDTLGDKAQEYNLTLSESILTPWQDGSLAVSSYQETFDTAMSSTMDQLDALKSKWQEVIDKMAEAGNINVDNINKENANYAAAGASSSETSQQTKSETSSKYDTYTVQHGDNLWAIAERKLGAGSRWQEIYNLNKDIISNPDAIQPGWNLKIPKYAKGTISTLKDQWAIIDELGEELQLIPDGSGRLSYMKKGTGIVPADLTSNLMEWGKLDPTNMLEQNRPQIGVSPSVINNTTEIHVDASVGELLHVEHIDGSNPAEISKIVDKAWDKRMKDLNAHIRRYTSR